jgi:hypothetical protein
VLIAEVEDQPPRLTATLALDDLHDLLAVTAL